MASSSTPVCQSAEPAELAFLAEQQCYWGMSCPIGAEQLVQQNPTCCRRSQRGLTATPLVARQALTRLRPRADPSAPCQQDTVSRLVPLARQRPRHHHQAPQGDVSAQLLSIHAACYVPPLPSDMIAYVCLCLT